MDEIAKINLYGTLFSVSMAVCILGALLAVLFFITFQIPKVFTQITGIGKGRYMKNSSRKPTTASLPVERRTVRSSELYSGEVAHPTPKTGGTVADSLETAPLSYGTVDTSAVKNPNISGFTTKLNGQGRTAGQQVSAAGRFTITQSIVEYHTNELI